MKLNPRLILAVIAIAALTGISQILLNSFSVSADPSMQHIASTQGIVKSGAFVKAEHPTTGTAKIVMANGKRYLELNSAFKTDAGPDLYVLLHRSSKPESYDAQNYVSLGRLMKVSGQQRYEIPPNVDLQTMRSAVIWCRQFNATFGYASLSN
ncbi:MAG: electron transfer flavoprotein [Leptolyngbyaceae cyanobacterium CSU_1_3]|nr:electron transfer flavoprotein [Leptolyngbyaceae cyanobacterium CSU_1_3]